MNAVFHWPCMYCIKVKNGDQERRERFERRMPKRIKKRRKVQTEDGVMCVCIDVLYIIH